ncbi:GDP-D-glucose phosphorylase 1 [Lingula anatina]|uniref:GDP-D-glucose phosphorylase 1 n=1 Tax=Lingula anatina TaxID=7574 RepID=A0A1S3J3R9_LINAN|nr:GDP-D-glucose phosphorylase 1 [Lingula anatina]|eukprot:XP_013404908.2 GDP-D-glucose phosphorylase 1 [Lingula anatina]
MANTVFQYSSDEFTLCTPPWDDKKQWNLSKFDQMLQSKWTQAMEGGHFRYTLDHVVTRVIPGKRHYVSQLNVKRGVERRKPQVIDSVNQQFNPDIFNFTKIKPSEVLFELCPTHWGQRSNGVKDVISNGAKEDEEQARERNLVIINISPLEFCNALLVPDVDGCTNQVITPKLLRLAIEMMLLSSHPGFRIGFNSLCAYASVNHQHVHAYYCNYEFYIEHAKVKEVHDGMYELVDTPARGFAFQLDELPMETLIRRIYEITEYFQRQNIAHNLMLVRGPRFGEDRTSKNRTIRLNLWPRRPVYGAKNEDIFNIAVAELGGHLPIKVTKGFENITEEEIDGNLQEASLSQEQFEEIKCALINLETQQT